MELDGMMTRAGGAARILASVQAATVARNLSNLQRGEGILPSCLKAYCKRHERLKAQETFGFRVPYEEPSRTDIPGPQN